MIDNFKKNDTTKQVVVHNKTFKIFFHIYQNKYRHLTIAFMAIFCPRMDSLNQILTIYMYTKLSQEIKLQHPSK